MGEETIFSFDEFSVEMEDFEVIRTKKHDRMWQVSPGGSMCCIPLIHDGLVYFGSLNFNVYALDARSGKLAWKFKTEGIVMESSPVFWRDRIFVGSFDYNMYALDAKTGRMLWKFKTEGEIDVMPWVDDGKVYFGSRDHIVYCLDAETGRLIWKFRTYDEIVAAPAVHDGRLFIGSFDKNMYCLDAGTGELVWKFPTQGEIHNVNHLLIHRGVLHFTSFDNHLYAVDEKKGSLIWKFRTGNYGNNSSPVLYKERLYLSTRDGVLYALALDGKLLWKFARNEQVLVPAIHDDRVYFGCEDHNLYCLDIDGNELWRFGTQGPVLLAPVVWEGKAYFPSYDCNFYAIDIGTRKLTWKFRAEGSPSYMPPPWDMFELVIKRRGHEGRAGGDTGKRYDLNMADEEAAGRFYKSRVTYQLSTQYREKGKYQTDSDEDAL